MRDACLDLFLGSGCTVCGRPGRLLCATCEDSLPTRAAVRWPTPRPPGLATPYAVGEYDGALKALVNAHKERRQFALADPLGRLLAVAVSAAVVDTGRSEVLMVPIPSRRATVRARGHDPMLRIARAAASGLRRYGVGARVGSLLRPTRVARDQAGLAADERAVNLAGSLHCPPGRAERMARTRSDILLVVVDDVITTGSTAREGQRALEQTGWSVGAVVAVAATRRTQS